MCEAWGSTRNVKKKRNETKDGDTACHPDSKEVEDPDWELRVMFSYIGSVRRGQIV